MKKTFRMMLLLAMMMATCVSMGSCSSDDADGTFSEQRVENYITGYKWYLDNSQRSEFRFYRNRLVQETSSSGVTSGSLTYAESNFFGTWAVADGKLVTTFTSGAYKGFDWNSILYGSLTITELQPNFKTIETTDPNGEAHSLRSYMVSYGTSNDFVDYTDNSDHDGALIGSWEAMAHDNKHNIPFTIKIDKKGKITFIAPSEGINFTTSCATNNGRVTFSHLLKPEANSCSFIYIREKEKIRFYSEENAQQVWVWEKNDKQRISQQNTKEQ